MTDSSEIDERVSALLGLLKKKDYKKIKAVGEEIADAAGDDEPWFEPQQVMDMMNIWLDACIAKVDPEVLKVTADCLRCAKVEDDQPHPGFPSMLRKVAKALDTPGAEHMETMLMVRVVLVKVCGEDKEFYKAYPELLRNPNILKIKDAAEALSNRFYTINSLPDEEAALCLKMIVDLVKDVTAELPKHTPGNMDSSKLLDCRLTCVNNLLSAATVFCGQIMMQAASYPKAADAIAAPTVIMAFQSALEACKPKPKEQDLKSQIKTGSEHCQQLMGLMPKGSGKSSDPVGDAKTLVKGLDDAKDASSLQGIMNQLMAMTDKKAIGIATGKPCIDSLVKAMERVKKTEYDQVWQTFPKFLTWAADEQPGCLETQGEKIAQLVTTGPVVMMQPRPLVDTLTDNSPAVAQMIWAKIDNWQTAVKKAKGTPMQDGAIYAVVYGLENMPRVLEGGQLEAYSRKMMELATTSKGTQMEDGLKCTSISGITSVVRKDKTKVPKDVLDWIQSCKSGDGHARDAAEHFMDVYEGRSLEGAYNQIKEANERFATSCGDMQSLKAYVDQNVGDMKDFVGSVVKKLPVPAKFSCEQRFVVKKAMLLHFECQAPIKSRLCALPDGKTFTTETVEWNRWLKMGLSAAKLGKSVLSADCIGDLPGAVDQCKEIYKAYSQQDDAAFLKYISEPFLTSDEQDQLLGQLRKAKFFKYFGYDPQTAGWFCANCHLVYQRAGRNPSKAALEAAAAQIESESAVPLAEGDMDRNIGLMEKATAAKDIGMEGKKAAGICFDIFGMCSAGKAADEEVISMKD